MGSKKISVIAGVSILIIAVVAAYFLASGTAEEANREAPVEVIMVPTVLANPGTVQNKINFTGRVIPEFRFDIYSEVTGRLEPTSKSFKSGIAYQKGDVIIKLNDDEQRQQLEAARYGFSALISRVMPDINIDYPEAFPQWERYLQNFDAGSPLTPLPDIEDQQLRLYLNGQNVFSRYSSIRQQEVRLEKFSIEAPFNGVVTESTVDPGALVQPNQRLGEFTKLNPLEIEASIPARQAQYIKVGDRL